MDPTVTIVMGVGLILVSLGVGCIGYLLGSWKTAKEWDEANQREARRAAQELGRRMRRGDDGRPW